ANPQKLFLGGLPWETGEEVITNYFGQFGQVLDCMVLRDNSTGKSRGFGFVTMATADVAAKLLEMNHELDGRTLTVRRATAKNAQPPQAQQAQGQGCCASGGAGKKIFLGGLDRSVSEMMIRAACEQHGVVTDVQMMANTGNPNGRGFGFVTFTEAEPAQQLIAAGSL
ncbi:hypothetical protein EMIHUDRAFT_57276, partial [Emiliania huxleyi CCMP1516]|uniref:RRM domain-containing protein n=2 Tax=Emiliania huxleyi TaxID=2903 RepID=A0A0D3KBL1_EMIH1